MQRCGVCRLYLHEDDCLVTYQFPSGGIAQACRDCIADAQGIEITPITYPVGSFIPEVLDGLSRRSIRLCGICRQAVRWDEDTHPMRVLVEDMDEATPIQPGAYMSCGGCVQRYKPAILARLIRNGILPAGLKAGQMPRNALL